MRNNEERFGANPLLQDASPVQQIIQQQMQPQGTPLEFMVPTEFVDLPSKGKFYPAGHPLRGKDTVEVKQMTAKEEDLLTSKTLLKKGVVLDRLIQALVTDKTIDTDSLTIEDRNAIIISARIAAYGPEYATSVTCPSCTQKSKYAFNLLEKVPKEPEEEVLHQIHEDGTFTVVLPKTKWTVVCRALSGRDEKTIMSMTEAKKKSQNDSMFLDQLKLMVVSIQGVTARSTVDVALSSLPAVDSRFLRTQYQKIVVPFDMKQNFSCSQCEFETILEVPLTADFFWPK